MSDGWRRALEKTHERVQYTVQNFLDISQMFVIILVVVHVQRNVVNRSTASDRKLDQAPVCLEQTPQLYAFQKRRAAYQAHKILHHSSLEALLFIYDGHINFNSLQKSFVKLCVEHSEYDIHRAILDNQ